MKGARSKCEDQSANAPLTKLNGQRGRKGQDGETDRVPGLGAHCESAGGAEGERWLGQNMLCV